MCIAASRGLCCSPDTFSRVFQFLQGVKCGWMYIRGFFFRGDLEVSEGKWQY